MPGNRDIEIAWKYHNATKHSYASIRSNPHALDWPNKPLLFKIYPTLEVTRLPREARQTGVSALSALSSTGRRTPRSATLNSETLAQLLFLSAGIGISFYPYIVPPTLTISDAAAPDESLAFLLIGAVVLVPIILAYTGYAYWVFRGKVGTEGYH